MNIAMAGNRKWAKWRRWWNMNVVGEVDHDAVLKQVADEAGWTGRYIFLILISAALSLLGLLMPSVAVLIGAMLISPLMMPIIGLGFGIATLDFREIRRAGTALALGSLLAVAMCVVFVAISPVQAITTEIAGRTRPTLFDLLVAFLSAVAGAYALIRGRGGAVVGVAIAIALMPPLAVVGFGIATRNLPVFSGALLLFITNAVTIALTAALVARIYGFGSHLSPRHTGWQLALFVGSLTILSIPLGAALSQIAFETVAQHQISDTVRQHFPKGSRLSGVEIDYSKNPLQVRAVILTPALDNEADKKIASKLEQRFGRPVDLHVDQIHISSEARAAEVAQLARAADSGTRNSVESVDRAVADLAILSGAPRSSVLADTDNRILRATAAPLTGLALQGYRELENRAAQTLPDWKVLLAPPADVAIPPLGIDQGVVSTTDLDLAAWASNRLGRTIIVEGGTPAQREAIVAGIGMRSGMAKPGERNGKLQLEWEEVPEIADPGTANPA